MLCTLLLPFFVFVKQLDLLYLFGNSLYSNSLHFINEAPYLNHLFLFIGLFMVMFLSSLIVLYRHKSNIKNIISGNERKIFHSKHKINGNK